MLVKGKTLPEQFIEPVVVDENGKQIITVTCEPTVGEVTARIWNVANAKSKRYIYVDGRIDNTSADYASHDGSSPEKAFKTLDEAYEEVLPGGYIIVCGDLDVDVWPENATKKVTITSKVTLPDDSVVDYYSEEVEKKPIFYLKNHIELRADTTFDNLRIQSVAAASKDKDNGAIESGKVIAAMGYKIVMGHEGDKNSLTMVDDKWPSIAGGGYSTQIANQQTEVTIYAGNYGTVAAYQLASTTGIYSTYTSGNVNIYGGTFLEIYAKKNLYDRINGSVTTVNVENATVLRGIYTLGRPYEANATYIFNIGKDMTFADEAVIHMGTRGNYSFGGNIILNMNGTGGKPYRVPMISTTIWEGSSQNQQKTTINLTQVTVGELYGGAYSTQCPTVSNATLDVCLLKNAVVENVYYGGLTDKVSEKVTVTIADNAAKINNLSVTCKGSSNKPEFAVLQFENVGTTDNPYVLDAGINLNGLTSVELINSVVDFTAAGNEMEIGELKADDKSGICHEGYRLDVAGNYIASSDDAAPTMWYGKGAPILNFSGTVDGYTKVFSKDVREESIDPGHFYHGIQIYAATNDGNVAENFVDYAGQALQFQKAAEGETADHWWLNDSGEAGLDTYVSQVRGHDLNQGTFAAPVRTLGAAYNNVQKLYESIKENEDLTEAEKAQQISALRIILLDDITVEETDNNLSNFADEYSVKITSYDLSEPSGIVFKDSCTKFIFPRDTVADYVLIKAIAQKPEMYAAGHTVVIGENVTTDAVKEHYPRFYGGAEKEVVASTNLTINGGSWSAVYGGGKNRTATVTGDVKLNVGNKIDMKNVGTYSQPNTGLFGGGYAAPVEGTITLNIDGGNYLRIHGGGKESTAIVEKDITVNFNYGTTEMFYGGGEVADTHNIITNLGTENSEADSESAKVTAIFRGSGLNAGLVEGCKAVVNIYTNALVEGADGDKVQFAAGGYSGNLDETVLNIYGGEIYSDIFGGGWGEGTPGAFGNVGSTAVNISGGKIAGNIFGGGNLGNVTETAGTNLLIKGGTISGNIYGGGNQASVKTTNVKFEDSANITGNIFGGGKGYAEETGIITFVVNMFRSVGNAAARLFGADTEPFAIDNFVDANVNETNIVVSGGTVTGNIYGGGELATVNVSGNTSEEPVTNVALNSTAKVNGNVYGGGQGRTGKDYAVVYGNTNVVINGDNVVVDDGNGEDSSSYGAGCVFGGGEIAPVNGSTSVAAHSGIVKNIFGGNDISGNISGTTLVSVPKESTAVIANIYGGGRDAAYAGDTAVAQVRIAGGTVANAYGGGYGATALTKQTDIQISGGTVVSAYGGGNAANSENTHITLLGGNVAEVFGGGNAASVTAAAVITVDSHNVKGAETVYAGNNAAEMAIQPTLTFTSGEIGTFYGGGKAGKMTKEGLAYNLNFENIKINEVYAGCYELPVQANGDAAVTEDVTLTLTAGTYGTVYGANNVQGNMEQTYVIVNELIDGKLKVDTIYGGGNAADTKAAKVELLSGTVGTVYGGGNNATVVKKVELIANGDAEVADMFGGNNQAAMDIVPTIEGLDKGMVTNFYGGGNVGVMNTDLTYTFDSADMKITNLYGGCNEADVYADKENEEYGNVTLTLSGTQVKNVFGGCNTSGNVGTTNIIVNGDGATNIYGGGYGEETIVAASDVLVKAGAVGGSIYGGSYNGTVNTTNVTVGGSDAVANAILVEGDVFGGGYGLSSTVTTSNVTVDMPVSISTSDTNADFIVTEEGVQTPSSEEVSSGETKTTVVQNHVNCNTIKGSVYGGGDMGQVGEGSINQSTNSAVVTMLGTSNVKINNGYIGGSVFGGGNGAPAAGMTYTVEMGTVFGSCNVDVTGGYVGESIYGCGNQSRVYADTMADGKRQASTVNITETDDKAIVVGQSVFGGGNKGDDKKLNASVPTVIGDTVVNITGTKGKATPTEIYFISGGVYGDGHLCLVTGDKTVNMTHFNYGTANRENLKTFYSLQRADVVNLTDTRIVLLGAEDLVDENSDGTVYSINRVEQLNMNDSSAIKLTTVVNLLGGLTSDQYTDRKFIENGKADVAGKLTEDEITAYRGGYLEWKDNQQSSESPSYNVVAVANGRYLEIKKDKDNYGNIAGLFVLELLYANPGEGGGFVYANHDASIGDFICTTYLDTATEEYMDVVDGPASDVSYYYWYIKGGKYTYDVEIIGYIGTSENKFTESARLATFTPDTHYILKSVTSSENNPYDGGASEHQEDKFDSSKLVSEWKNEYNDDNKYAVEVKVHMTATNGSATEKTLGFLAYENNEWGLKVSNSNTLTGYRDATNTDSIKENELFEINEQTTEVKFEFVLYKGTGVDLEIKDVPVTLTLDIFKESSGTYEPADAESQMRLRTYTSIVRIVPTQAAYLAEGRVYAGIATSAFNINITKDSSFTAQFITRYVPNAFGPVTATLTTKSDEIYLLDETNGIGFTVRNNNGTITKLYDTEGDLDKAAYDINVSDDIYYVKYGDSSDTVALDVIRKGADGFELPKGTVITMISRPDDGDPVYYYYLCNEAKTDIPLTDFVKMNTNGDQASEKYVSPIEPDYGNRVTENMTFIFDFSNVSADWMGDSETLEENIQLKHIATELNGYEGTADIMEYVSETNVDGKASYERVTPEVITGAYFNSDDVINGLSITADKQSYFTNDTYTFTINVNKKAIPTNTRYEEREYAVVLSMVDEVTGAEVPFPTGARFTYDGQTLETCNDNKQVVVPISVLAAGNNSFEVVMETVMAGIDTDSVKIKAQLYSAADAEYFNSINTAAEDSVSFRIVTSTVYALSVVETEDVALTTTNHILVAGETPSLEITTNYGGEVSVTAYSYNSSKKAYEEKNISDVFNSNTDTEVQTTADKVSVWKPMVRENAQGVWRLEFTYYDRTEYWDFIVE